MPMVNMQETNIKVNGKIAIGMGMVFTNSPMVKNILAGKWKDHVRHGKGIFKTADGLLEEVMKNNI
jgi:hypothetical protein